MSTHEHGHAPVRIAAISLAVTACLLGLKLVLGIISDSIAVLSDAVDSGTDLTAGTAALLAVRIAASPADEEHPYGHGKVETLSAAVAAGIIGIGGAVVVFQAVRRLIEGVPEINVGVALVAMVTAALANVVLAYLMRREAGRSHSLALRAESTHLQTNVVQAGTIITGLLLVWFSGEDVFDPLVALGLAAYMGWTAVGLVRTSTSEIMDRALPEVEIAGIQEVLAAHPQVLGFHRLRSRRTGATRHVDMHVGVDPQLTIAEVHEISEALERDIRERLPGTEVVIHLEPHDGAAEDLEVTVREKAPPKS